MEQPTFFYRIDITPVSGSVVDGDMKRQAKVVVTFFESPASKGKKVATTRVTAWSARGLTANGDEAGRALIRQHIATQSAERRDAMERIEAARVSLIKKGRHA